MKVREWPKTPGFDAAQSAVTEAILNCYTREGGEWRPAARRVAARPGPGGRRVHRRLPLPRGPHGDPRRHPSPLADAPPPLPHPGPDRDGRRRAVGDLAGDAHVDARRRARRDARRPGDDLPRDARTGPDAAALAHPPEHQRDRPRARRARRRGRRAVERRAAELHRERAGRPARPHGPPDAEEPLGDGQPARLHPRVAGPLHAAVAGRRSGARRARQRDRHAGGAAHRGAAARRPVRRRRGARRRTGRPRRARPAARPPLGARPPARQRAGQRADRRRADRRARRARQRGHADGLDAHRLPRRLAVAADVHPARAHDRRDAPDAGRRARGRRRGRALVRSSRPARPPSWPPTSPSCRTRPTCRSRSTAPRWRGCRCSCARTAGAPAPTPT